MPGLVYVNLFEFPNGSLYKGQMNVNREKGIEERCGFGIQKWVDGAVYEGECKAGKKEGRGTFRFADGNVAVGRYAAGADVGIGARWSVDGRTALKLKDGKPVEEISLEAAAKIAAEVGEPVPSVGHA